MVTQDSLPASVPADVKQAFVSGSNASSVSAPQTEITSHPRHFASYHPVVNPGDPHHGNPTGSSSVYPRPLPLRFPPATPPPSRPSRTPSPPSFLPTTPDNAQTKPRPSPRYYQQPEGTRSAAAVTNTGIHPPRTQSLKPTLSLTSIRSNHYTPFRNDRGLASATPFSPGSRRFMQQMHHPELHFDFPRSSLQSATTNGTSSIEPASGTERSSVATGSSSMTEPSPEKPEEDHETEQETEEEEDEGGMSVDDAIDMYLDGFSDDPLPDVPHDSRTGVQQPSQALVQSANPPESDTASNPPPSDRPPPLTSLPSPGTPLEEPPTPRPDQPLPQLAPSPHISKPLPSPALAAQYRKPLPSPTPSQTKVHLPDILSVGVPPPLSAPTAERDQYGFRKVTAHVNLEAYDTWHSSYLKYVEARRRKWVDLLTTNALPHIEPAAFPSRSSRVKRYVRKGIPAEFRGSAWFWYADGYQYLHRNPGLYRRLVESALKRPMDDDKEHIERDLHRTFPDNIHYKPPLPLDQRPGGDGNYSNSHWQHEGPETPIIQSLRRVLYAFSVHNPKIGYTQSLNFIAGLLLLFLPEEKAFWLLHIITSNYLPGTHEVSLEGANADLWILMVMLRETVPAVYTKVASSTPTSSKSKPPPITTNTRLPDITLGLTNWLMSMFISSLPLETTLRVWDVLFYEGPRTFFRVALAIFRLNQKQILAVADPMEIFQLVQTAPKRMIDPNILTDECFARRFKLSQSRLESLRAARREAIRAGTDRVSFLPSSGKFHAGADGRPSTSAANTLPDAWRTLKSHLK